MKLGSGVLMLFKPSIQFIILCLGRTKNNFSLFLVSLSMLQKALRGSGSVWEMCVG